MLNTWEYGWIRIVSMSKINRLFDTYIRNDIMDEWEYWQLANGEIVAVPTVLNEDAR